MKETCYLEDEEATLAIGMELADVLCTQSCPEQNSCDCLVVYLHGDLGAGKTTLSRGLLRGLGHEGLVKSPTYTLVEPYQLVCGSVYHFDLYRLADPGELLFMGADEYFANGTLCLVEWPEKGLGQIPSADIGASLQHEGTGRLLLLEALSEAGEKVLKAFSRSAK